MSFKGETDKLHIGTGMEYDDSHDRHAGWPQRSKVKIITSRRQYDAFLPITQ